MPFQHKSFWMQQHVGRLAEENTGYENSSRSEPKRVRQWFTDTGEPEMFSNKKQAVEVVSGKPLSGVSHVNVSPWDNNTGFHSVTGQFSDRLFGCDLVRGNNFVDKNMTSIGSENVNMGRKDFESLYPNNPSMGLSISHTIVDPSPCLSFGGARKVKVNQVRDSNNGIPASIRNNGNCFPASLGLSYSRIDDSTISTGVGYNNNGIPALMGNSDNCFPASLGLSYSRTNDSTISIGAGYNKNVGNISLAPIYDKRPANTITMGTRLSKGDENPFPMSHAFNKGERNVMLGRNYGKRDNNILSMGLPYERRDGNFMLMGQSYEKDGNNMMSMRTSYTKGYENFISIGPSYSKPGENFISIAPSNDKGNDHIISSGLVYDKLNSNIPSSYKKGDSSSLPMGHNHCQGESSTISFGSIHEDTEPNPSGGIISGYNLFASNHNETQGLNSQKDVTGSNSKTLLSTTPKSNTNNEIITKNKEPKTTKKAPTNNFPSNVKSLLSTGIFDGIIVKYVSWSREKNLNGVIKGTGYLCSCDDCNHSKALNAYEFERHAGAKTKHPNNHIYFENGKTIYAVVQELKNTPQDMLFDTIQTVTGSAINQKNFRVWKASYQAATKELQRIYGNDKVAIPS